MTDAPRLFLDLDGTLIDPGPGIIGSVRHALDTVGADVPEASSLGWCIGPPLQESLGRLTTGEDQAKAALEAYRAHYSAGAMYEARVYDAVPTALQALQAQGLRLFLATSKPLVYARRITSHFGLDAFFEDQFGSELDGTRTAKRDLLAHALVGTGTGAALMVGDRRHDVEGAHANGLPALAVCWGYGSTLELTHAGADLMVARPEDLPGAVSALLPARPLQSAG